MSSTCREDGEHLEVAAGTGEPGLTIAARMQGGRVVLTDLSAGMLAAAAAHAKTRGLTNVEIRESGVDDLSFADASFDTVGCRFGLMFFPDIPAAVREMLRVLRPGGRLSVAVWADPPGNPWATIPMAAIAAEVEMPPPDPDAPGLFRCAVPGTIAAVFEAEAFRDVSEHDVEGRLEPANFEEYWEYITEIAAPVVAGLTRADPSAACSHQARDPPTGRDVHRERASEHSAVGALHRRNQMISSFDAITVIRTKWDAHRNDNNPES